MTLRSVRHQEPDANVSRSIESPAPGVVLIDLIIDRPITVPLHWRAGTWTKPPLDIALDGYGRMKAIQVILQDETVSMRENVDFQAPIIGSPIFEIANWPGDRYLDERMPVDIRRTPTGRLVVRLGNNSADDCTFWHPHESLHFGLLSDGVLRTIVIGPLTADEWSVIDEQSRGLLIP